MQRKSHTKSSPKVPMQSTDAGKRGGSEFPMLLLRCRLTLQQRKVNPGVG